MSALQLFHSTSSKICMWSSYSKEDLLKHYGILSDPLKDLLEESSQISPTDLSSEKACIRATESLTHLFEKLSLEDAQEEKVEKVKNAIFAKIQGSDLSKLSMYHLIERIHSQTTPIFSLHANCYIARKMSQIQSCQVAKGIIYKVTNEHQVTSFMIGTFHQVPQGTLSLNGRVSAILSVAEELILECELSESKIVQMKKNIQDQLLGFNYSCDIHLFEEALKNKIKISFLESSEYCKEISKKISEILGRAKLSEDHQKFLERHGEVDHYEAVEAFQKGDFERVAFHCKSTLPEELFHYCSAVRNRVWIYGDQRLCKENQGGLLMRLKNAKSPLVIAVGAGHMFFQEGLSKTFKKEGLIVERDS